MYVSNRVLYKSLSLISCTQVRIPTHMHAHTPNDNSIEKEQLLTSDKIKSLKHKIPIVSEIDATGQSVHLISHFDRTLYK